MPDWYVQRNEDGPHAYSVRLGGCEYSFTEAEMEEYTLALYEVWLNPKPKCIESEDYKDLVIASGTNKRSLDDIMGKAAKPINRRGM